MPIQNNSFEKGLIPLHPEEFNGGTPMDTARARFLISNLENLQAGATQVRVNTLLRAPSLVGGSSDPVTPGTSRLISTFGPFPLTVLKDGTPAPLYVEILGAASKGASSAYIVAVLRLASEPLRIPPDRSDGCALVLYGSTTLAWNSLGVIQLPRERIRETAPFTGRLTTAGEPIAPNCIWAVLDLWASMPIAGSSDGVLFQGCYATEIPFNGVP